MVRFIQTEDTLSIRSEILREGILPPDKCRFPADDDENSFHLGYYQDDKLASIATFHQQEFNNPFVHENALYPVATTLSGKPYQLRGMATLPEYRNKGLGTKLINFAIVYLRGKKVDYLWCNARTGSLSFYLDIGFEIISDEFEIKDIGPHKSMYLKI